MIVILLVLCLILCSISSNVSLFISYFQITSMSGWTVVDIQIQYSATPFLEKDTGRLLIANDDMSSYESYYWMAPEAYMGSRLLSYGQNISFSVSWVTARGDTGGKPTRGPDVILVVSCYQLV